MPLVSIIIPTFNSARFLKATLDSVAAQTFRDFDVVVVDNHSTDGTKEIATAYRAHFAVQFIEEKSTQAEAKNIGLRHARGDLISFLDSDDLWDPEFLSEQVRFLGVHPEYAMSHTYVEVIDEQGRVSHVRHEGRLPPSGDCYEALFAHCWITLSSVVMRRSLIDRDGLTFPDKPRMRAGAGEDWRFFLLVAKDHPVGLINRVLVRYRRSSTNVSSMSDWRGIPEDLPTLELIIHDPRYWRGRLKKRDVRRYARLAARANASYWWGQGFRGRWLWFTVRAYCL